MPRPSSGPARLPVGSSGVHCSARPSEGIGSQAVKAQAVEPAGERIPDQLHPGADLAGLGAGIGRGRCGGARAARWSRRCTRQRHEAGAQQPEPDRSQSIAVTCTRPSPVSEAYWVKPRVSTRARQAAGSRVDRLDRPAVVVSSSVWSSRQASHDVVRAWPAATAPGEIVGDGRARRGWWRSRDGRDRRRRAGRWR